MFDDVEANDADVANEDDVENEAVVENEALVAVNNTWTPGVTTSQKVPLNL